MALYNTPRILCVLFLFFVMLRSNVLRSEICTTTNVDSIGDVASLITCINTANSALSETIIDLGGASFTLSGSFLYPADGLNGLPSFSNSAFKTTIQNGSIKRSFLEATPDFRLLHVASGATLELVRVTIENGNVIGSGGGIHNSGILILNDSTVSHNSASDLGGGVYNASEGNLTIYCTHISDNTALDSSEGDGGGGGIFNSGLIVDIEKSTISGNKTNGFGAGINNHGNITQIIDSTLSANRTVIESTAAFLATGKGGGIYNHTGALLTITNSTIAENTSFAGGGFYNYGSMNIYNSTIAQNTAHSGGGGIFNFATILELVSSIVANNTDTAEYSIATPDIQNLGSISEERFNLIGNNDGVASIISGQNEDIVGFDPLLGPLQNNGGPTFTMALLSGSLALNNGLNYFDLEFDQRGPAFPRVAEGRIDIGAYELQKCSGLIPPDICEIIKECNCEDNCDRHSSHGPKYGNNISPLIPALLPTLSPAPVPLIPPVIAPVIAEPIAPVITGEPPLVASAQDSKDLEAVEPIAQGCAAISPGSSNSSSLWPLIFMGFVLFRRLERRRSKLYILSHRA